MTTPSTHPLPAGTPSRQNLAAFAGFFGATVEYYDFLLYAMAASVVFPQVFFPSENELVGTLVSFAGLAVGYFARPLGGLIFAHFGDRFGRKSIVVITITLMGAMTILIGLIPSYQTIGIAAPIILVALRVIQGIALGGEFGGTQTLAIESGHHARRGWAGGLVMSGGALGAVLANLALAAFSLPAGGLVHGLGGWAWRIPFLLSVVLVIFGLILRMRLQDSPEYRGESSEASKTAAKFPLTEVLVHYPKETISGILGALTPLFMQGLLVNWMLSYAKILGYPQEQTLWISMVINLINIFGIVGVGILADRIGRKKVLVTAMIATVVLIWPVFYAIQTKTAIGLFISLFIGIAVLISLCFGTLPTWVSEKFPSNMRYTGFSLTYQIASSLGAGLAPLVAASLLHAAGGQATWIIGLVIVMAIISGLTFAFSRETYQDVLPVTRHHDTRRTAGKAVT